MGRPPCCEKIGVKKGPWTPEEDIILVSYVQEHGPGNWRGFPTNTDGFSGSQHISKGQWEKRLQTDIHMAKQALFEALSAEKPSNSSDLKASNSYYSYARPNQASSTYALSTENIARLLQGWAKNSPKSARSSSEITQHSFNNIDWIDSNSSESTPSPSNNNGLVSPDAFESMFGFESSTSDVSELSVSLDEAANFETHAGHFQDSKPNFETQIPISLLEKWLLDDGAAQGQEGLIEMALDNTAELF
ncbi:hypothetical protein HHK36_024729 [Tetracentron sinense]|uniref:Uncharacterized protein n=1 Tax=Tetracentron sinense TaxID=13715 RepID=A0A834YKT1_TETSI|nr:hypothetical protein HHK36_024729 [Tetracentron sinense]